MNRRFGFETELYTTLSCLPLAARYKLDILGIKISIKQWLALEMNERRAICEMPADSDSERRAMSEFVNQLILQRCGEQPALLSPEQQASAIPPSQLPTGIAQEASGLGYELDAPRWKTLNSDQRYALLKFGGDDRRRTKFAAALKEFLG
jgi:hypothetical protein